MRRRSRRAMAAMAVGVGLVVLAGVPSSAARSGALPSAQVAALAAVVGPGAPDVVGMLDAARTALPLAPSAVPAPLPLPVAAPAQVPNPCTDWGPSLAVLDAARGRGVLVARRTGRAGDRGALLRCRSRRSGGDGERLAPGRRDPDGREHRQQRPGAGHDGCRARRR